MAKRVKRKAEFQKQFDRIANKLKNLTLEAIRHGYNVESCLSCEVRITSIDQMLFKTIKFKVIDLE